VYITSTVCGMCTGQATRDKQQEKEGGKGGRKTIEQSKSSANRKNRIQINMSDYNDIDFQILLANLQSIKNNEYIYIYIYIYPGMS